mgnify:CR=1 FL=1
MAWLFPLGFMVQVFKLRMDFVLSILGYEFFKMKYNELIQQFEICARLRTPPSRFCASIGLTIDIELRLPDIK